MADVYNRECQPIPNVGILDATRDDGKIGRMEFSNPEFFIDEWIREQTRQREEARAQRLAAKESRKHTARGEKKEIKQMERAHRQKYTSTGDKYALFWAFSLAASLCFPWPFGSFSS
jgi:hypothetical protein